VNYIHYTILQANSDWTEWYDSGKFFIMEPLLIAYPGERQILTETRPTITGTGHAGASLWIVRADNSTVVSQTITVPSSGSWSVRVNQDLLGDSSIKAAQSVPGYSPLISDTRSFLVLSKPQIIVPAANSVVKQLRPIVSGTGLSGATVKIYQAGSNTLFGTAQVINGSWNTTLSRDLPQGPFTFTASQTSNGMESDRATDVPVTVLFAPVITTPAAGSLQDPTFTLSGNMGNAGARVRVYSDFGSEHIGESNVLIGANWSCSVTVPVGPVSLAVSQVLNGGESERSVARLFKIRPPVLAAPTVVQTHNTVTFSGTTAHTGATVRISKLTGPGELELPTALVSNASWEIIATDWPFGTYCFSAIQDVSDNAQGTIPSVPYEFNVTIGVAVPTEYPLHDD
jgi:hypothetical protein